MCGIAGFVDFTTGSNEAILKKMIDTLRHRGPDGDGIYFCQTANAQIGLGHRRLSIIDLSESGAQPMHYDGLHISFNGEIYNYREITEELRARGHTFNSHSDTEVILHSIREWGMRAVDKWKGMFALVVYDENKNEIYCLRDRAGVKPFYYYCKDGVFSFASELKAIMAHPNFPKEVSPEAVALFLQYGYVPQPYCIFQHTHKLKAGHYLTLNLATQKIAVTQYWNVYDYYNKPKLKIDLPEAIAETEKILEKAFNYRMVADVPVGMFLSGGYDSTCVTAFLQKDRAERIKTFTIGSFAAKHNEAPFAKKVAAHLGTDHTEYYCTPKEALDIIPALPYYYDEPFADSSAIPTILVSRLARKQVTVALSADAGDEIFAGYTKYDYFIRYSRKLNRLPKPVRRLMTGLMNVIPSQRIPYLRNTHNFHSRYEKVRDVLREPSPSQLMNSAGKVYSNKAIDILFRSPVKPLPTYHASDELTSAASDPLSYMMAIDYQTYLTDDILQKVDRATMSISLEGREPFLDQSIIEWAAQLPSSYKYRNGEKKFILKKIVQKYVPKELMERPKMGFSIPIDDWMRNELKDMVLEYLDEKKLGHGFFEKEEVLKLRDSFFNNPSEPFLQVWHLLMFQMWYEQWVAHA